MSLLGDFVAWVWGADPVIVTLLVITALLPGLGVFLRDYRSPAEAVMVPQAIVEPEPVTEELDVVTDVVAPPSASLVEHQHYHHHEVTHRHVLEGRAEVVPPAAVEAPRVVPGFVVPPRRPAG